MPPTLGNFDAVSGDFVNEPIFFVDAAAPVALFFMLKGFRISDSDIAVPLNVFQEAVDFRDGLSVLALPNSSSHAID
jgi:hypothetical protein